MKRIDDPNVAMVELVAARVGNLRARVVFLGGAATGLLVTDYLGSHDLEDVVSVLDGRDGVVEEVAASELGLQEYLAETLAGFLHHDTFRAALQGNLPPDKASQARFPGLLERIQRLCSLPRR